jgi:amidase
MLDGYIPDRDATIVTRMLDAGAEIVAKLNMDNMAFSGSGATSAFGPVLNPHSREHLADGSSAVRVRRCITKGST